MDEASVRYGGSRKTHTYDRRLMKQMVQAVKQRKPNVIVSLSLNNYGYAYQTSLQDWRTWKQQKLIGKLMVQAYRNDLQAFMGEVIKSG